MAKVVPKHCEKCGRWHLWRDGRAITLLLVKGDGCDALMTYDEEGAKATAKYLSVVSPYGRDAARRKAIERNRRARYSR